MNWKRPGNQLRVSCTGNRAAAILSCLLLLAGCAYPPKAARQSVETTAPGATTSVRQETAAPKPVAPAARTEPSTTGGEPVITFEKNLHDFGEVGPQSRSVCEFRFKNTGMGRRDLLQRDIYQCSGCIVCWCNGSVMLVGGTPCCGGWGQTSANLAVLSALPSRSHACGQPAQQKATF